MNITNQILVNNKNKAVALENGKKIAIAFIRDDTSRVSDFYRPSLANIKFGLEGIEPILVTMDSNGNINNKYNFRNDRNDSYSIRTYMPQPANLSNDSLINDWERTFEIRSIESNYAIHICDVQILTSKDLLTSVEKLHLFILVDVITSWVPTSSYDYFSFLDRPAYYKRMIIYQEHTIDSSGPTITITPNKYTTFPHFKTVNTLKYGEFIDEPMNIPYEYNSASEKLYYPGGKGSISDFHCGIVKKIDNRNYLYCIIGNGNTLQMYSIMAEETNDKNWKFKFAYGTWFEKFRYYRTTGTPFNIFISYTDIYNTLISYSYIDNYAKIRYEVIKIEEFVPPDIMGSMFKIKEGYGLITINSNYIYEWDPTSSEYRRKYDTTILGTTVVGENVNIYEIQNRWHVGLSAYFPKISSSFRLNNIITAFPNPTDMTKQNFPLYSQNNVPISLGILKYIGTSYIFIGKLRYSTFTSSITLRSNEEIYSNWGNETNPNLYIFPTNNTGNENLSYFLGFKTGQESKYDIKNFNLDVSQLFTITPVAFNDSYEISVANISTESKTYSITLKVNDGSTSYDLTNCMLTGIPTSQIPLGTTYVFKISKSKLIDNYFSEKQIHNIRFELVINGDYVYDFGNLYTSYFELDNEEFAYTSISMEILDTSKGINITTAAGNQILYPKYGNYEMPLPPIVNLQLSKLLNQTYTYSNNSYEHVYKFYADNIMINMGNINDKNNNITFMPFIPNLAQSLNLNKSELLGKVVDLYLTSKLIGTNNTSSMIPRTTLPLFNTKIIYAWGHMQDYSGSSVIWNDGTELKYWETNDIDLRIILNSIPSSQFNVNDYNNKPWPKIYYKIKVYSKKLDISSIINGFSNSSDNDQYQIERLYGSTYNDFLLKEYVGGSLVERFNTNIFYIDPQNDFATQDYVKFHVYLVTIDELGWHQAVYLNEAVNSNGVI